MQLCCDLHGQRKQRWQVRNSVSGRSKALTQRDGLEDKLRIGAPVCHAIERHAAAACRLGSVWTSDVDVFALGIKILRYWRQFGASFLSDGALFVSFSPATSFGRVFRKVFGSKLSCGESWVDASAHAV